MNVILMGSAVVLLFTGLLLLTKMSGRLRPRTCVLLACLAALFGVAGVLIRGELSLGILALIGMLVTMMGTAMMESHESEKSDLFSRTLIFAAGCVVIIGLPTAVGAIISCGLGLFTLVLDRFDNGEKGAARVFMAQNGAAFILMIIGFVLADSFPTGPMTLRAGIAGSCLALGLFLMVGIPPFQAGILDAYENSRRWEMFPLLVAPLAWFLALRVSSLLPQEMIQLLRYALLVAIVIGSIAALRAGRAAFLSVSRYVLLSWAILFLFFAPATANLSQSLLSFSAYLTPTVGLHVVYRLASARIGWQLVMVGGLARQMPGLASFALFFALTHGGLPLTANFFISELIGESALGYGVGFIFVFLLALAFMAIAAYRNYTETFLGKGTNALPPGLDLKFHERIGLAMVSIISPGTPLLIACLE